MADWQFLLTNIATDTTIADITSLTLSATLQTRLNRPQSLVAEFPIDQSALATLQADGDPALFVGTRAIKGYRNGVLRSHLIVWTIEYQGNEDYSGRIQMTAFDPTVRFTGRWVYDDNGRLLNPVFPNPIDSGTLLKTAIDSGTQQMDHDDPGNVVPLLFPIDTNGTLLTGQNVWALIPDTPVALGDLYSALVDSGVVDFHFNPVESSQGFAAGIMAQLSARDSGLAPDKSGYVHFDYQAGSKNVSSARRVLDASTLGNRIYYYIGPRKDKNHFRYLITGNSDPNLAPFHLAEYASRRKYGTYGEVRVYDDDDDSGSVALGKALWRTEVMLRVNPRDLVYYTPAPEGDNFSQFQPFDDFTVGDIVAISSGTILGPPISNTKQRIYGFDINIDDQGVERMGELIASADAE